MTTQTAAMTALAGFGIYALLAFGLRSWVQLRRTGRTGFVGLSRRNGAADWLGGGLFVVALALGVAAPVLQLAGVVTPSPAFDGAAARGLGVGLYVVGVAATSWAQFAMGESWRIGVDPAARTAMVAAGPFRWVRNPIFTAMTLVAVGLALLAPNVMALAGLLALVVALEIQVRLVEEPYLAVIHGARYREYARRTGRFVPGLGRFAPMAGARRAQEARS
jgi:protein-S-isoprenylcysteine O-methyltransferase Ste14